MERQMGEWMGGRMDGWIMDGWVDPWIEACGWMHDGWVGRWVGVGSK